MRCAKKSRTIMPRWDRPLWKRCTGNYLDVDAEFFLRVGAGESLSEIGQKHPELRDGIVRMLEDAMVNETEDAEVAGWLVSDLMDLGAKESYPIIEKMFLDDRIDPTIVGLPDVQEHFGLPRTPAPPTSFPTLAERIGMPPQLQPKRQPDFDDEDGEVQKPFVAVVKTGRNEPCPCGSGKKYKKCHGAA